MKQITLLITLFLLAGITNAQLPSVQVGGKEYLFPTISTKDTLVTKADITMIANRVTNVESTKADTSSISQTADYIIEKVGSTYYARPGFKSGLPSYSNTDAYTVIQNAINALTVTSGATIGTRGGKIMIKNGSYTLSNELTITGWENQGNSNPGYSQLVIQGAGKATHLIQNTSGKNGILIKNNASVAIEDLRIECGSSARSAIRLDGSGTDEISVFGGKFDNLYLQASSSSYPALYAQNFFDCVFGYITAQNSNYDAIILENASTTTLYGNSQFNFIRAIASTASPYAGLRIKSTDGADYRVLDLITFNNYQCVSSYYGVYISDGSNLTFNMVDIEYGTVGFHIGGGTYARNNYVKSGLISVNATSGTCIETSLGGNTFNCNLGGGTSAIPIHDTQSFEPPNSYDVVLTNDNSANISITQAARTFLRYRKPSDGRTYTNFGDNVTATTQAAGDNSTAPATTAFVYQNAARQLLYNNTKVSAGADITEDTLFAANIPASSIGINGSFHIIPLFSCTNSAGTKTFRIRINGTVVANEQYTTTQTIRWNYIISNRNSASSQIAGGVGSIAAEGGYGTQSGVAVATYSFNTAATLRLTITAQKNTTSDAASLEALQVIGYY
jgi:hypothetical protein